MPGSPFFFGDTDSMADSSTAADILRKKFPALADNGNGTNPAPSIPLLGMGRPTVPASASLTPGDMQPPDVGRANMPQLPWMPKPAQPQKPPRMNPITGEAYPTTKAGWLVSLLKGGLEGAMAGRASSEEAVIQSGGRRSGGFGMGAVAGMEAPAQQAMTAQALQRGRQSNQLTQMQINQANALNQAYQAGATTDPQTGAVGFDRGKVMKTLAASGQGSLIPGITQSFSTMDKSLGEVQAQKDAHAKAVDDYFGSGLQAIVKSRNPQTGQYDPGTAGAVLAHLAQVYPQEAEQFRSLIAANPGKLNQIVDGAIAQSPSQQKLSNEAWKTVDGRLINTQTGATMGEQLPVDQLNAGLAQRFQILNPGRQLPASFTLPPSASKSDFDRIDKLMQQTEQAQGTKALRDQSASMREQTLQIAKQGQQDREQKQGLQWVMWQDKDGRTVAGPLSLATQMGAQNPASLDTKDVQGVMDSRQAVNLINKQGNPKEPSTWGVNQLIDSLEKDKQLGVATSRLNAYLAGKVGAAPNDDPRIMALLDKSQLLMTLSMKAHFGASGGRSPQMLDHFLSMANAKTMNAQTLRSGTAAVGDYMTDRAMMPGGNQGGSQIQVTDPSGGVHTFPDQASADRFKSLAGIK
jgi:hypothetical protein